MGSDTKLDCKFRTLISSISSETPIGVLLLLDILSRSREDFQRVFERIFGRTWEYKILILFIKFGRMHKAELCSKLFPSQDDAHYKLSRRSSQIVYAFNYLLENRIIVVVEDFGRKKIYDISPSYKLVLQALIYGDVFALLAQ